MKHLISLLSLLALAACSSGGGGGGDVIPGTGLPAPTDQEKQRMGKFGQEMVDVQKGTSSQSSQMSNGGSSQINQFANVAKELTNRITASQKGDNFADVMQKAIANGDCIEKTSGIPTPDQKKINQSAAGGEFDPFASGKNPSQGSSSMMPMLPGNGGNDLEALNMDMKVTIGQGKTRNCPIDFLLAFKSSGQVNETPQSVSAQFGMELRNSFALTEVGEAQFSDLDIFAYDTRMGLDFSVNGNQAAVTMSLAGSGETTINSSTDLEGDVKLATSIAMNLTGSENSMQMSMQVVSDYSFVDFRVVGVIRMSANSQSEEMPILYYINGTQVSESEYFSLMAGTFSQSTIGMGIPTKDENQEIGSL